MAKLPTSDILTFRKMLDNPGRVNPGSVFTEVVDVKKHFILNYPGDSSGCGHIRSYFPMAVMNSLTTVRGDYDVITSPILFPHDEIMAQTRSVLFQRIMGGETTRFVSMHREMSNRHKVKMIYDIDDYMYPSFDGVEGIPSYNYGADKITLEVLESAHANMSMCEIITTTTPYLADMIHKFSGIPRSRFKIVENALPMYLWGKPEYEVKRSRKKVPTVLWAASPSHWSASSTGDMNSAWVEYIIKAVTNDEIRYVQMGGLPWFFESIKDKIEVVPWLSMYQYHLKVKEIDPDICIGPLQDNHFNRSKSDIKMIESFAINVPFVGTKFRSEAPSPYDTNLINVYDECTVAEIEEAMKIANSKTFFNDTLTLRKEYMENRWIESPAWMNEYIALFQ